VVPVETMRHSTNALTMPLPIAALLVVVILIEPEPVPPSGG